MTVSNEGGSRDDGPRGGGPKDGGPESTGVDGTGVETTGSVHEASTESDPISSNRVGPEPDEDQASDSRLTRESPPEDDEPEPEPGMVLAAGGVIYGAMAVAALVWLWMRDRMDALPEQAIGEFGPLASSGLGLVVGLLGAWCLDRAIRHLASLQEVAAAATRLFAKAGEGVGIAFVLIAAIAEELFFRLAVQDAFGLLGSVAIYVLMNSSVGGARWLLFTLAHALVLGLIVHQGFGLLGSTTAHAILNYLSLRRIQNS